MSTQGYQGRMLLSTNESTTKVDGAFTFDASSYLCDFESESLVNTPINQRAEGVRGTRQTNYQRHKRVRSEPGGNITLFPSWDFLNRIFFLALGTAGPPIVPGLTVPFFGILVDKGARILEYRDCKVNRLAISGSGGGAISASIDILALSVVTKTWPGTPPSLANGDAAVWPIAYECGSFSYGGGALNTVDSFELVIDNQLQRKFQMEKNKASYLRSQDQVITLATDVDMSSSTLISMYDIEPDAAPTATLTFADTANDLSMAIVFAKLVPAVDLPANTGKNDMALPGRFEIARDASNNSISITPDTTPSA